MTRPLSSLLLLLAVGCGSRATPSGRALHEAGTQILVAFAPAAGDAEAPAPLRTALLAAGRRHGLRMEAVELQGESADTLRGAALARARRAGAEHVMWLDRVDLDTAALRVRISWQILPVEQTALPAETLLAMRDDGVAGPALQAPGGPHAGYALALDSRDPDDRKDLRDAFANAVPEPADAVWAEEQTLRRSDRFLAYAGARLAQQLHEVLWRQKPFRTYSGAVREDGSPRPWAPSMAPTDALAHDDRRGTEANGSHQ